MTACSCTGEHSKKMTCIYGERQQTPLTSQPPVAKHREHAVKISTASSGAATCQWAQHSRQHSLKLRGTYLDPQSQTRTLDAAMPTASRAPRTSQQRRAHHGRARSHQEAKLQHACRGSIPPPGRRVAPTRAAKAAQNLRATIPQKPSSTSP